jgi:hypothetical protein
MITAAVILGIILWVAWSIGRAAQGITDVCIAKGEQWSAIDRERARRRRAVEAQAELHARASGLTPVEQALAAQRAVDALERHWR